MSNAKLRRALWIFIILACLLSAGIYVCLHPSKYTEEYLENLLAERGTAFQSTAAYLSEKVESADITAIPTMENNFGVPSEDTNAYHAYADGVIELINTTAEEIKALDGTVLFYLPATGGIFNRESAVIAYRSTEPVWKGAPKMEMSQKDWSYFLFDENA